MERAGKTGLHKHSGQTFSGKKTGFLEETRFMPS
jgi:hypothetical protein